MSVVDTADSPSFKNIERLEKEVAQTIACGNLFFCALYK